MPISQWLYGNLSTHCFSWQRLMGVHSPDSFTKFWSERRCAGGALQQGYAVTSKFIDIFSFFLSLSVSLFLSSLLSVLLLLLILFKFSRHEISILIGRFTADSISCSSGGKFKFYKYQTKFSIWKIARLRLAAIAIICNIFNELSSLHLFYYKYKTKFSIWKIKDCA